MLQLVVSPGAQDMLHTHWSTFGVCICTNHLHSAQSNFYLLIHMGRKDAETQPALHILWVFVLICLPAESMLGTGIENTYLFFSFPAERSSLLHKVTEICIDLFGQGGKHF